MADFTARIKPKKSSTAGEVPQAADLEVAELAVNTADGKLFVKHTDDSIKEISGGGGATTIDDLADVDTSTVAPTDGQVLTWDNAAGQWEPATPSAAPVDSVAGKTGAVTLELTDNTDVGLALNAPSLPAGTVVAITGEGTNGETTFVNSATANSGNGTAAGNAQISNAQSKFYGTSIALDGSGDAVVIAHDDEQNLGGNDFTVQFWVRFNSLTNGLSYSFCDKSSANTTDVGWRFWYSHSTTGNSDFWYQRSSNGFSLSSEQFVYTSNRLAVDTWYHIRLCQFGGTALCFLDGVHIGSSNPTGVFEWASSADLKIGAQYTTNSDSVNGYFNDFQIINGTALSTSTASFTPPSTGIGAPTPVPPTDGQVLTYVTANSRWEPATPSVVASIDDLNDVDTSTVAPTDGQVLTWDNAAGQWEPATPTSAVDSVNGKTGVVSLALTDMSDVNYTPAPLVGYRFTPGTVSFPGNGLWYYNVGRLSWGGVDADSNDISSLMAGTSSPIWWSYDGITFNQITFTGSVQGPVANSYYVDPTSGAVPSDTSQQLYLSFTDPALAPGDNLNDGDVLAWNEINSQWEPATPTLSPITGTVPASNTDTGTAGELRFDTDYLYVCIATNSWKRATLADWFVNALLLHFDGDITDSSFNGYTLTNNAAMAFDASVYKFGTGAIIGGSGQWLELEQEIPSALLPGTGDFCVDFWFYVPTGTTTSWQTPFSMNWTAAGQETMLISIRHENTVFSASCVVGDGLGGTDTTSVTNITAPSYDAWHHFAFTREGTTTRVFIDGVQEGTGTSSRDIQTASGNRLRIGRYGGALQYLVGTKLDELRMIVGSAEYTTNFTPPTAPY